MCEDQLAEGRRHRSAESELKQKIMELETARLAQMEDSERQSRAEKELKGRIRELESGARAQREEISCLQREIRHEQSWARLDRQRSYVEIEKLSSIRAGTPRGTPKSEPASAAGTQDLI